MARIKGFKVQPLIIKGFEVRYKAWEVVCPDGLVRAFPYVNIGDADSHAKSASNPAWFARNSCRTAPTPNRLEQALPPCIGGRHVTRQVSDD